MSIVDNTEDKDKQPDSDYLAELAINEPEGATPNVDTPAPEDDLPSKYQGKSTAEVARMHQELEQRFGQQGNEVGQLRRTLDEFILKSLDKDKQTQPEEEPVDYFADPDKAVDKAIRKSPEVKKAVEAAERVEKMTLQNELMRRHPDTHDILQNSEFQKWVGDSKLRQRMLAEADQHYDIEAADELLSEWKTMHKKVSEDVVENEAQARKSDVKKASTGTARGAPSGRSSSKIFRRADIVELIKKDPARYESLMPEIRKAYQEGRVR